MHSLTQGVVVLLMQCHSGTLEGVSFGASLQVASGSAAGCEMVCRKLVPEMAAAATPPDPPAHPDLPPSTAAQPTQQLALESLVQILVAAGKLAATGACAHEPLGGTGSAVFRVASWGHSRDAHTGNPEPDAVNSTQDVGSAGNTAPALASWFLVRSDAHHYASDC